MKFIVEGNIVKGATTAARPRRFSLELEANSEKHARELAIVKIGSTTRTNKVQIKVLKVAKKV